MTLSRRQVLKHAALIPGAAAVSPLLMPFMARAQAETEGKAPPLRFVFVVKSSGLTPAELVPQDMKETRVEIRPEGKVGDGYTQPQALRPTEKLIDKPLANRKLHAAMASLEPFKKKMAIVQGLSGKMCKGGHSSWFGAMGCYRAGGEHNSGNIIGPTIDGVLAQHMPGIFPHVGLTTKGRLMGGPPIADGVVYPGISAFARNRQIPYQATPLTAYQELFSVAATSGDALMENRLNGTLLDFMVDDIKRLESRIGGVDREKLEIYLEGFESLRERRRKLKGREAQVRKHAPKVSDKYTSRVETDRIEAHFDIAAAALIAGLTNVVTIRPDTLSTTYTGLGVDKGVHGLGHGEGEDPLGHRRNIRKMHCEQIARLAAKLEATPEGKGNMLDNTLIVYFSDAGEKHHASSVEWPFVLIGGLGGRIKTTGRYLQFPAYERPGHHTIANLYNTFAHATGIEQDEFGQMDLNLPVSMQTGPLAELVQA
jgi:hypothetical protein